MWLTGILYIFIILDSWAHAYCSLCSVHQEEVKQPKHLFGGDMEPPEIQNCALSFKDAEDQA